MEEGERLRVLKHFLPSAYSSERRRSLLKRLKFTAAVSVALGIPLGIGVFVTRSEPWSVWRVISVPLLGTGAIVGVISGILEAVGLVAAIVGACILLWTRTGRAKWFWIGVASAFLARFVPVEYAWWSIPLLLLALLSRDEKIREIIVDDELEREPKTPTQALFTARDPVLRMRQIANNLKDKL